MIDGTFLQLLAAQAIPGVDTNVATANQTGLPGGTVAAKFLGGVVYYGTLLVIAGFVLSAGLWAVGAFSGNYTQSINGKKGFMICAGAALVVGGAYALTAFFYNQGSTIS